MDLTAELRETPPRYLVLAGVFSALLLVLSFRDLGSLVPYTGITPLDQLLALAVAALFALPPLLALVRPWAGVALAVLWCATMALGVLLVAALCSLLAVSVTAMWRSRAAGLTAAGIGLVAVLGTLVLGLRLVNPVGLVDGSSVVLGLDGLGRAVTYLGSSTLLVLVVAAVALLLRRGTTQAVAGQQAVARSAEVEQQSAVTAERARLARDLHDVVAHHVSLIAVRAETAPYTHPGLDAQARGLLAEIARDARQALDELRGVLGILGRSSEGAERAPQPGLVDVPGLVDRSRSAGAQVTLDGDVHVATAPAVGYVAYRVVQEALTNARRHAPGSQVAVHVGGNESLLVVQVGNPVAAGTVGEPGRGLAGMRERVEAVGGHLEAGRTGDSFLVRATLPRVAR